MSDVLPFAINCKFGEDIFVRFSQLPSGGKDFAYPIYWFQEEEILQDVHSLLVSYIPAVY